ncbi:MAG: hypothetical protein M1822_003437 [Bathelium mastoideum]|nr:MAG: hypothetical protein M1822_003437 [Bathelium mastoideum]
MDPMEAITCFISINLGEAFKLFPWCQFLYLLMGLLMSYYVFKGIHNVYWHPLSDIPGPPLFAISRIPYAYCHVNGRLATNFHALHKRYGPVVRTAPNELSFIELDALIKIYAERKKFCPVFRKNYDTFNETNNQISNSVFLASHEDHSRMRKVINPAFSDRALRNQEPRMQRLVQKLILLLDEQSAKGGAIDLNQWYNYIAFDIIADITFGEPFNTLEDAMYQPWINLIGKTWKAITLASAIKSVAPPLYLIRKLLPTAWILQKEVDKFNLVLNRVKEKIATGATDQKDLLSLVIRSNDEKEKVSTEKLATEEIISNSTLFVAAGTETVTTLLSSLTYLLTRHPQIMNKLVKEVRDNFEDEASMTIENLAKLEYLYACIREALRLFPPIPEGLPRVVPAEDETISGYNIPGGTFVQVSTFAAVRSTSNFTKPDSFIPERWLKRDPRFQADKLEVSQPFSIGPRNCVGQNIGLAEMRLVMARVLWRFDLRCPLKHEWMDQSSYLLWEKKPLPIELVSVRKA